MQPSTSLGFPSQPLLLCKRQAGALLLDASWNVCAGLSLSFFWPSSSSAVAQSQNRVVSQSTQISKSKKRRLRRSKKQKLSDSVSIQSSSRQEAAVPTDAHHSVKDPTAKPEQVVHYPEKCPSAAKLDLLDVTVQPVRDCQSVSSSSCS